MINKISRIFTVVFVSLLFAAAVLAQGYTLVEPPGVFKPAPEKKVLLFTKKNQSKKLILFYSQLRVNTDGSPRSYHPEDLEGKEKAINNICNGISVYDKLPNGEIKLLPNGKKSKLKCADARVVFKQFQANNWVDPPGYHVFWTNVLAPGKDGKPCLFKTEPEHIGYFGSLTTVRNKLDPKQQGECGYKDQLDALTLPNLVLPAATWTDPAGKVHKNPLQVNGAKTEDLVFAYNPENNKWSYAIIGDGGPDDNLGEGSVALNMRLLGKTAPPKTYTEAKESFDTGSTKILVAIIPGTGTYNKARPFTPQNIETRGKALLKEMGFNSEAEFIAFLNQQKLKF